MIYLLLYLLLVVIGYLVMAVDHFREKARYYERLSEQAEQGRRVTLQLIRIRSEKNAATYHTFINLN